MRAAALILGLFSPFIFSFFRMRTQKIHHFVDDLILKWEEEGGAANRPQPDYLISECVIVRMKLLSYIVCIWFFLHVASIFIIVQYIEYWLQFEIYLTIMLQFTDICCIYILIHLYRPTFGYLGITSSKRSERMQLSKVLQKQRAKEKEQQSKSLAITDGNANASQTIHEQAIDMLDDTIQPTITTQASKADPSMNSDGVTVSETSGLTSRSKTIDKLKGAVKRSETKRINAKKWKMTVDGVMLKPRNVPIEDQAMDMSDAASSASSIPSHTKSAKFRKVQKLVTATNRAATKHGINNNSSQFGFTVDLNSSNKSFQSIVPTGDTLKFDESTSDTSDDDDEFMINNTQSQQSIPLTNRLGSAAAPSSITVGKLTDLLRNTSSFPDTTKNDDIVPQHRRNSMTAFAAMARKVSTVKNVVSESESSESDSLNSSNNNNGQIDDNVPRPRRASMTAVVPKLNMADIVTQRKKEFTFSPQKHQKQKQKQKQLASARTDFAAKLQMNSTASKIKKAQEELEESSVKTCAVR